MAIGDFLLGAFLFTPSDPGKGVVDSFGNLKNFQKFFKYFLKKNFLLFQKFFQKISEKFSKISNHNFAIIFF